MSIISRLKLSGKMIMAFAAVILVVLAAGAFSSRNLAELESVSMRNTNSIQVAADVDLMLTHLIQQENALRAYTMLGREEMLDEYRTNMSAFATVANRFRESTRLPEQQDRLRLLQAEVKELNDGRFAEIIALTRDPATRERARQMSGGKQLPAVRDIIDSMKVRQVEAISEQRQSMTEASSRASMSLWVGVVGSVLIASMMAWMLSRAIASPLVGMTVAMTRLADGNTDIDVPATDRKDEVGAMAKALLVFRQNAQDKARADIEIAKAAKEQTFINETISDRLARLATGDLTATVTEEFPPAFARLKSNYNEAVNALSALIVQVMGSATQLRTGSSEIAQASEDLARRTESNAANLEETAAAITQIDQRIKATAHASERTVAQADQAIRTVSGGRSTVDEAVQAMGRVSESAKGIDSVIEGLDKIAFQTRVLAMNAAVEAGRAGEAGRGFAVVADLVSALAMRAEEESKRARDQLTVTQTDIVTAVDAVQKVDGSLAAITEGVGEVHSSLGTMATDNQAQAVAITQISSAIGSMDQATQQNAAMVEETSAAARNLLNEVSSLSEQAGQFNTGSQAVSRAAANPHKVSARAVISQKMPTALPERKREAAYVSPVAALPGNGSMSNGSDDWQDF